MQCTYFADVDLLLLLMITMMLAFLLLKLYFYSGKSGTHTALLEKNKKGKTGRNELFLWDNHDDDENAHLFST